MDLILAGFFSNVTDAVASLNYTVIFQLFFVALIMLSGPIVIFLLAFRGGDL